MPDGFTALVERVMGRLETPPRVVTPEEYRAITCNRCGRCCDDIPSPHSPDELAALLQDPSLDSDRRVFLTGLVPAEPVAGGWQYRCRHFHRDADGLGMCDVYEARPAVCSGFPYGGVVRRWTRCAWYVQVRDADGNPVPRVLPDDHAGAVPGLITLQTGA